MEQAYHHRERGPEDYLLDRRRLRIAGVFALAGLILLVGLRVERFGGRATSLSVTRDEAVQQTEEFCRHLGLDLRGFEHTAWFYDDSWKDDYARLVRQAGVAQARALVAEEGMPWRWQVRWVKPQGRGGVVDNKELLNEVTVGEGSPDEQPTLREEVLVEVDATSSRIAAFDHRIPQHWAGATLEADTARLMVQEFLAKSLSRTVTDPLRYRAVLDSSAQRAARLDHFFAWERVDPRTGEGRFRINGSIQGDQIGYMYQEYQAPESFLKKMEQEATNGEIWRKVLIGLMGVTVVLGVVHLFVAWRRREIRWGFPLRTGILAVVLVLAGRLNDLPGAYAPDQTWYSLAGAWLMEVVGWGVGTTASVALGMALLRVLQPDGLYDLVVGGDAI